MDTSSNNSFDKVTCQDPTAFKEYIKRLRTVDDTIIFNLNTELCTPQSQSDVDRNKEHCKEFRDQLNKAYETRNKVFEICLAESEAKLKVAKSAQQQNESDLALLKEFKRAQTEHRMMQKESTYEQAIQDRSLQVLRERCRRYML